MRALRWCLILALCSIALLTARRVLIVDPIAAHTTTSGSNSLDPQPAPAPPVFAAAPTIATGPTTIHAPALTRASVSRPSLRWLPGTSLRLSAAKRPALHLAATPLLI